jgi:GDP-L-fucose synthase
VTNLRLFGVYGPKEGYLFRFISNSIVKALLGMDLVVRQDVVFDYLHVSDLVAIVDRFLQNGPGVSDVNVTPTESISLRQILAIISSAAGRPLSVAFQTEGLNFQYTGDNGALLRLLPDLRFTPYEEGIRRLYSYYAARREALDRDSVVRDDYLLRTRSRRPQEKTE